MSSKICILCLTGETLIYNIFEYSVKELPQMIVRCTAVEVLKDDGFPSTACVNCIEMVIQFDVFRKQCQFSDSFIKKNYKRSTVKHEEVMDQKHNSNDSTDSNNTFNEGDLNLEPYPHIEIEEIHGKQTQSNNSLTRSLTEKFPAKNFKSNNKLLIRYICDVFNNTECSGPNLGSTFSKTDLNFKPYAHIENKEIEGKNVHNNKLTEYPIAEKIEAKNFETNNKMVIEYGTDEDDNAFNNSESSNDSEYHLSNPPNKGKQGRSGRHHLIYSRQDYAILGKERKVRIYEMDDTMRAIIGNNVYTCEICTRDFTSFFDYYDHQEVHNGQSVFECDRCNETFLNRQDLVEHDAHHKVPCKICDLEVLPKSMSAHMLIHTDIHKCQDCGMRHTSKASLEKHIKARHTGIKGFVCHVCGKQSSCQSSMNRHMAYHSNERPYKCKYCDFCAKTLNIVQVHTSRRHFAEKCVCEICAKLFKSQLSVMQHMKRMHTPRKHICDICSKAFTEKCNLTRHMKKHAVQVFHECKLCHKDFLTVRKLKEHMHSHRQGCVDCPKCRKVFFYKKHYNKHVLKCKVEDLGNTV